MTCHIKRSNYIQLKESDFPIVKNTDILNRNKYNLKLNVLAFYRTNIFKAKK